MTSLETQILRRRVTVQCPLALSGLHTAEQTPACFLLHLSALTETFQTVGDSVFCKKKKKGQEAAPQKNKHANWELLYIVVNWGFDAAPEAPTATYEEDS